MTSQDRNNPELEALVLRAQQGDDRAFAEIVGSTQKSLFRFCYYLCGDQQMAEDLTQDALVKVLDSIRSLKEPARFMSWLMAAAKNLFLDRMRSAKNRESEELDETIAVDSPSGDPGAETMVQVRQALSKLSQDERVVLLLIDMEGRSYKEAAEIIGISEDAVRSRLHRARKAFEQIFFKS